MARANALVDEIRERPRDVVTFAGGGMGRLDLSQPRSTVWEPPAEVLRQAEERGALSAGPAPEPPQQPATWSRRQPRK